MIKKTITTLSAALMFTASINSKAQNPNLTIPGKYLDVSNGILNSIPTVSGGYDGAVSYGPHNSYNGADGKPIIYATVNTIDYLETGIPETTVLFTKNGYKIGGLYQSTIWAGSGQPAEKGPVISDNETVIVPDPGNCKRFYVIGTAENYSNLPDPPADGDQDYYPYFALIDMSIQIPGAPIGESGQVVTPGSTSLQNISNLYTIVPNDQYGARPYEGTTKIAVSKARPSDGNSRLLFVFNDYVLYTYKITASGIQFIQMNNLIETFSPVLTGGATYQDLMGEMEIYEQGNTIKFATPLSTGDANNAGSPNIALFDMNISAIPYTLSNPKSVCISVCAPYLTTTGRQVGGIEFSPNGQYVYFTHETSSLYSHVLEWVEYSNISNRHFIEPGSGIDMNDFKHSQIELGLDGKMYLATSNRLACISNPNAPTSTITYSYNASAFSWNNNAQTLVNYPQYWYAYLLPDQIDQDTYGGFYQNTPACCYLYSNDFQIKNAFTFPANNTYVITAGSTLPGSSIVVPANGILNINNNIIIPATTKVTFQNLTLKFSPNASLIVNSNPTAGQQGGKVAVYNSTLTAYTNCETNAMWPGVVLNGINNGTTNQGSSTNSQNGVLTTMGSSQIDHALTAIKINGGAIAIYTNSRLYDNKVAIEATPFTPPNAALLDASLFQGSTIKTQSTFNIVQPSYFVNIVGRQPRFRFISCTFANEAVAYHNIYDGIISNNSTLWVSTSTLTRLREGIHNTNTNAPGSMLLTVGATTLNNNASGIYVGTTNLASITGNRFNILDNSTTIQWPNGLVLDASSKFKVSGNTFKNFILPNATVSQNGNGGGTTGLIARNTSINDANFVNIIEGNNFNMLNCGVSNVGQNYTYSSTTPHNTAGLRYYCNTFQTISWNDLLLNWGTIDYHQGVSTYASQNQFSHSGVADVQGVGLPAGTNVDYSYSGTGAYLPTVHASTYPYFMPIPVSINSNDCSASAVGSPGGKMANPPVTPETYLSKLNTLQVAIDQLNQNTKGDTKNNELAYLKGQRDQLQKEVLMYYLNDSTPSSSDSAKKYMERFITERKNNKQLVSFYLSNGNVKAARKAFSDLQSEGISANLNTVYSTLIDLSGKDTKAELLADKDLFNKIDAIANDKSDIEAYLLSRWIINQVDANTYRETFAGIIPTSENTAGVNAIKNSVYKLSNYPNPFENTTTITVSIPQETKEATIKVTDVLGREVSNYTLVNGNNTIEFKNENTKGLLFYTLYVDGSQVETKIMMKNN